MHRTTKAVAQKLSPYQERVLNQPLLFSAFVMNTPSHILHGVWRQPGAGQVNFNSLEFWVDLARELEAGLFGVLFFADVHGVYGNVGSSYDKHVIIRM